jgi:hypothetical protein
MATTTTTMAALDPHFLALAVAGASVAGGQVGVGHEMVEVVLHDCCTHH